MNKRLEIAAPPEADRELVAKAAVRAADFLGLTQSELAGTIGISEASASRMAAGTYAPSGKAFELALYLIRIYRSLDAIAGGDRKTMRAWMASENTAVRGVPRQLVLTGAGLVNVMNYLDASRAPV